jgi:hypothetical protein
MPKQSPLYLDNNESENNSYKSESDFGDGNVRPSALPEVGDHGYFNLINKGLEVTEEAKNVLKLITN